jgi:hypothetical protein
MPGQSHSNLSNKDTHDLFMLCIVFMCSLYRGLFIIVVRLFCSCFDLYSFFCSTFVLIRLFCFHCSLFKRKRFKSDPGLYSRYFDPAVPVVQEISSSYMQVNKHHNSECNGIVLV